jgi:DNA-binding MarR family transcriptional regulator
MVARSNAREVAEVLHGLGAAVVRRTPRDVSLTAVATLATLQRTGPRRITDLAVVQGVSQPSMTSLISGLEREGLVERRSDLADGRVALVAITDSGAAALRARRHAGAEAVAELIAKLGADDIGLLEAALPALQRLSELDDEQREPRSV